jgi:phosphoglycolate phosphatase-like HAD superfamily hydrolase
MRTTRVLNSLLQNIDGGYSKLFINLIKNMPIALFFFDIDKTLVHIEYVYKIIRPMLWPILSEMVPDIDNVHLAGFQLGTMWHEMYRMKKLEEGHILFLSPQYTEAFFSKGGGGYGIEDPKHPLHYEADQELKRFDVVATQVCEQVFMKNPEVFEQSRITPIFQLLNRYRSAGIPMFGMSANPRGFIRAVCRYSGLGDYFIDCGNDTVTTGMKEYKMLHLIKYLELIDLPIPYHNLRIFGDSPNGDVGSGPRFETLVRSEHPDVSVYGTLVCENVKAYSEGQAKILTNNFGQKIEAIVLDQIPFFDGEYMMQPGFRKYFLKPI